MASKTPIFPMPTPHHYSDYGFDPQIDYCQVFEDARRCGRRSSRAVADAPHFKLLKPISKDDRSNSKKRRKWWRNALGLFWRAGRVAGGAVNVWSPAELSASALPLRCRKLTPSGPLYAAESASAASTQCRTDRRNSGPLRAAEFAEAGVPYMSLRDLNLLEARPLSAVEPTLRPIYLVT